MTKMNEKQHTLIRQEAFGASICPPSGRPFKCNQAALKLLESLSELSNGANQYDESCYLMHIDPEIHQFAKAFIEKCRALDWKDAPFNWKWYGKRDNVINEEYLVAPYSVYIYPSLDCNIENICSKCYVYFSKKEHRNKVLDMTYMQRMLDELANMGVFQVTLLGGEPLTYPYLEDFFEYCSSYPFIISMSSNGLLLDDQKADLIAKYLNRIQISLDGASPEDAEILKGIGTYSPSIRAIKRLVVRGVSTIVSYVLTTDNSSNAQIRQFVECMADIGISHVSFIQYYPSGDTADRSRLLDVRENHRIRDLVAQLRQDTNLSISHEDSFAFLSNPPKPSTFRLLETTARGCSCGRTRISIYPNGDVLPCDFLAKFDEFVLGNIKKTSIADIWANSPVLSRWRNRSSRVMSNPPCNLCNHRENCGGACQAMAYLYTGDDSNPDPRCPLVQERG